MDSRGKTVYVGMSGGVDSSVTAALLKERGFDVRGVHIKMWSDDNIPCQFKEDRRDALRVADKIGIPFETWDLTDEYRDEVVNYMIAEYAAGRTPNPDVMCNRKIKFGVFLQKALERGADFIATGHYVRMENAELRMVKNEDARSFLPFPASRINYWPMTSPSTPSIWRTKILRPTRHASWIPSRIPICGNGCWRS